MDSSAHCNDLFRRSFKSSIATKLRALSLPQTNYDLYACLDATGPRAAQLVSNHDGDEQALERLCSIKRLLLRGAIRQDRVNEANQGGIETRQIGGSAHGEA